MYFEEEIKLQVENHLRTMYMLEDAQIDQMLTTTTETMKKDVSAVETALKNRDFKGIGEAAHSIKGSLLNLGLNDLAKKIKTVELSAKESLEIDYQKLLSELCNDLKDLLETD